MEVLCVKKKKGTTTTTTDKTKMSINGDSLVSTVKRIHTVVH